MPNTTQELRDEKSSVWDMSQERAFIENLLNTRFNFFIVFFSLVIGAALNSKYQIHLQIILIIGVVITWLFALTLFRSQKKLDLILKYIFENEKTHPATVIDVLCNHKGGKRKIIGYVIPFTCCLILTAAAVLSFFDVVKSIADCV